ncbi:3',5'-cyclic adenosine monophosphate phosphodiesterase CpdA [Yaniella flava]|uniref:3',5'-cyclic adenosine monophosphate phosphodiesterase CpdA n=1 Tax=Yaniella flava TaxID=287930 RepID=A0ABN2UBB0_9MICC|nr:metallophosphoesterase [Micrococcaceae bacterium]
MVTPHVRLVQITDVHLTGPDQLLFDRVDTWQQFCTALSAAGHFNPDGVLVTGDVYDKDQAMTAQFTTLIETAQHELGCPVILLPGNHDTPPTWQLEHVNADSVGPEPGDSIHTIRGLRIISLNTHGQQVLQGHLTAEQLRWLGAELETTAIAGTVIAMHHPPVPTAHEFLSTVGLADPSCLAQVLNSSDVRLIVSGHLHFQTAAMLGSIPVWSGPALAYQQNAYAPAGTLQGLQQPGISIIDVFEDTHAVVPVPLMTSATLFTRPIPQ